MPLKATLLPESSVYNYITNIQTFGRLSESNAFLKHRFRKVRWLYHKDLYSHYGCVNAIEFSDDGEWLVSGGDDKRVLVWNVDQTLSSTPNPKAMKGEHNSNIFCLRFDIKHEKLFSAGNDEQVILHDVATGETADVILHNEAVYGLSVDPKNQNVFASACDDGRIVIWDIRESTTDGFVLADCNSAFHAVMHNPVQSQYLVTANAKDGVGLWDIRSPLVCLIKYGTSLLRQSAMSVRFNSTGTQILSLRRRLPPVLYDIHSAHPAAHFDHKEYYNSCTMKSCCFAGPNDEYVLSGSDDFKLYVWKIPEITSKKGLWINDAHAILRGHRSIVNQVRYNPVHGLLVSSGVEKIIKLWSSFPLSYTEQDYLENTNGSRKVYSHEEYINLVLESGQFMTHDYSHHSVQEDPRMMAFFDSLVQRDIEGLTSDSSETSAITETCFEVQSTTSSSSLSEDEDDNYTEIRHTSGLNFSTVLSPSLLGNNNINTEPKSINSNEISKLIAKKRYHLQRKTHRLKRNLKRMQKKKTCNFLTNRNAAQTSTSYIKSLEKRMKKQKILMKKRAKLLQRNTISDYSSDSDLEEIESRSDTNNLQRNVNENETPASPKANTSSSCLNGNSTNNSSLFQKNTEDILNTACTNSVPSSVETSTTPTTYFQPRKGKYQSRNYRKRVTDDAQDDS